MTKYEKDQIKTFLFPETLMTPLTIRREIVIPSPDNLTLVSGYIFGFRVFLSVKQHTPR